MNDSEQFNFDYPSVITFDDITEISAFEDAVALEMQPDVAPAEYRAWSGRVALRDLIRPPKFNGSIRNIEFAAFKNPTDQSLNASDNGWAIGKRSSLKRRIDASFLENTKGFVMTADALSSGKGRIGEVQTAIWYVDVPRYTRIDTRRSNIKEYQHSSAPINGGSHILRVTSKPKLEKEKFLKADDEGRRVGFSVMRSAMLNPMSAGLPRT